MKKQTATKIILCLIIFVFVVSIFQFALPAQAATTSMSSLYSNPNQNSSKNPFKFKVSDVVNSQILTSVVGCTGVVSKVSTWMAKFLQSPKQQAEILMGKINKLKDLLKSSCASAKAGVEAGVGATPVVNDLVSASKTLFGKIPIPSTQSLSGLFSQSPSTTTLAPVGGSKYAGKEKACLDQIESTDPQVYAEQIKQTELEAEANLRTQCFDGIAITLARNQLTSMTRSMMNWVNSGYGGNPFFVQNMRNLTSKIERNVLETGIDILLSPGIQSPYAMNFSRSTVRSRDIVSSSSKFLGGLQSDLEAFISDPQSYYTNNQLYSAMDTMTAVQRAQYANNAFANDFSVGGWNAWLALTQRDQNNPLGYSMLASQYLADMETQQVTQTKDELAQNNGFLSQKTCVLWDKLDANGAIMYSNIGEIVTTKNPGPNDPCDPDKGFKVITPGSLIKDKTTSYLTSPDRQLELAKTINDALNALFSSLLSKLEGGGLLGLSDNTAVSTPMNWTDSLNNMSDLTGTNSSGTATPYNNNGAYDNFNITRDLGNTYIHGTYTNLGDWNATECPTGVANPPNCNITTSSDQTLSLAQALNPDSGPEMAKDANGDPVASNINTYFTVTNPGKTKLLDSNFNNWEVRDRAFWDGTSWQDWKCGILDVYGQCTGQTNPIKNRGVLQIQQDYILAAKEIMKILPSIMPKLGKLDYCLPGPNPSYKTNSTDAQSAYQDWIGSIYVGIVDNSGQRYGVKIDGQGDRTYDNLRNIYADNPNTWNEILNNDWFTPILQYEFNNICNDNGQGTVGTIGKILNYTPYGLVANLLTGGAGFRATTQDCTGNYFWVKAGLLTKDDSANLQAKTDLMDLFSNYVNNNMFQNFYEVFDKMMNKIYFNNITQKYLLNEKTGSTENTNSYAPMAQAGYDLTKDMLYYNDEIAQSMQDYATAVNQAQINIAKLQPIKDEVSQIITDAQKSRNDILAGLPSNAGLSPAQIQTKYATCLAEENVQVFDADLITSTIETGNCSDGIDNDLDGLIDMKDPDCQNTATNGGNVGGSTTTYTTQTLYYTVDSCPTDGTTPVTYQFNAPYSYDPNSPDHFQYSQPMLVNLGNNYYVLTNDGQTSNATFANTPNIWNSPINVVPDLVYNYPGGPITLYCPDLSGGGNGNSGPGTVTNSYIVNAIDSGNGTGGGMIISPSSQTVPVGYSGMYTLVFTVIPDPGSVATFQSTCGGSATRNQYTTAPITQSCDVIVTFNLQ